MAPIICFGPLVTDVSVGFDHVTAAVGQSQALLNGAAMVITITASEHLGLPCEEEVKEGCIIARHVCHSVDLADGKDQNRDFEISVARERHDWNAQLAYALDRAGAERTLRRDGSSPGCSMCGKSCAYLAMRESTASLATLTPGPHSLQPAATSTP